TPSPTVPRSARKLPLTARILVRSHPPPRLLRRQPQPPHRLPIPAQRDLSPGGPWAKPAARATTATEPIISLTTTLLALHLGNWEAFLHSSSLQTSNHSASTIMHP